MKREGKNTEVKEKIIRKLQEEGFRITKQRMVVIDAFLEEEYESCKELIYKASKKDKTISPATVYRTLKVLEDVGALSQERNFRLSAEPDITVMVDGEEKRFSREEWEKVIQAGMQACGYLSEKDNTFVVIDKNSQ